MPRSRRYIVPGHLHEAELKCFQARFLLWPDKTLNRRIIGALAYAQQKYGMKLCYPVVMSNHIHWLYVPDSCEQARDFFRLAHAHISREASRLAGWDARVFPERYSSSVVSEEAEAQEERLRYCLAQGVKEGLVKLPEQWPGVQAVKELLNGSMELEGEWVDRTAYFHALKEWRPEEARIKRSRVRGKLRRQHRTKPRERDFVVPMTLKLSPIPAWEHLTPAEVRSKVESLRESILAEYAETRAAVRRDWKKCLTSKRYRKLRSRPKSTKRGQRPRFHCHSKRVWGAYMRSWRAWSERYHRASARLRKGTPEALTEFPDDCFLPTGLLPRECLRQFALPP